MTNPDLARTGRLWHWAAVASLLLALLVTSGVGYGIWRKQEPPRPVTVGVGERAEVDGVGYTVTRFDQTDTVPPADPEEEMITAPEGAVFVLVMITIEPGPGVDVSENYCDLTVSNGKGTTWRPDHELTYDADLPTNMGCTPPDDAVPGAPFESVGTFVIPRTMAEELIFEITWSTENRRVTVRP
ncbi:hypothetical protein ACQBAR_11325 [Propionibacteriaceae bacterium Y1685]